MAGNKPSRKPVGNWSGRHNVRRRPQPHQGPLASWINQHKHAIRFSLKRLWFNPVSTWITLAAIAPIPLWLSSLALFVPSLLINMVIGILALFGSTGLIYHGVYALFHMRENLQALQMATVIAGAGLFAWLVLVQIVLMH